MKKFWLIVVFLLVCVICLSACEQEDVSTDEKLPNQSDGDTTPDGTLECDHAFGDWAISKEATCSEEGELYRVCSKCSTEETKKLTKTDEHNFSVANTNAMYLVTDASCASPAIYYYSCICGEKGSDVFEYGEKSSEHLYNAENTCTVCSEYKDIGVVFTFDAQTNTYCVTDYQGNESEIVIPSIYKGFTVSSIGEFAFCECKTITTVKLPSTVVSIDSAAFMHCSSLKSVTFGNDTKKIGNSAFAYCSLLENIKLPSFLAEIGQEAFAHCTSVYEINIPDTVISIGESAFRNCSSLKSVTFGKYIQKINKSTFAECSGLEAIEFPSNITEIGETAFYGCSSLAEIVIPETVEFIGNSAFYNCTKLEKVTLPFLGDKKMNPTNGTFQYIFGLGVKEVVLTGGNDCGLAEQIPNNAFDGYSSLEKIVLPDTIVIIGDRAFCETSLSDVQLPDSLISIGDEAFLACKFTKFIIPNSVSYMGEGMVIGNPLESLTLPFIGRDNTQDFVNISYLVGTPYGYHPLKNVTITVGNKWMEHRFIPQGAFQDWSALETVNLHEGITQIRAYAFEGCSSLQSVNFPKNNDIGIGGYAFSECTSLKSISISNGGEIGEFAFYGCTALTEINLGSVSSIGEGAFRGCEALTNVSVPNTVTTIGFGAFGGCVNLEEISIPFTGSSAGNASSNYFGYIFAFSNFGVDADPSVYQSDVPQKLKTVYYTSGENMLWQNAFENCYYIENIYISEGLETIGTNAFKNSGIKHISLPKSLTVIGAGAFEDCILLESIVLGDNLTTINDYAFKNTSALKNIYFRGTEEEWNALMEDVREEYLYSATKHYNYVA